MQSKFKSIILAAGLSVILSVYFYQQIASISKPLNLTGTGRQDFFWHNLYNGFGFLQNRIGITGDSQKLYEVLLEESSAEQRSYVSCARSRVVRLCKQHPFVFLSVFFAKGAVVFFYFILCGGWLALLIAYFYSQTILFHFFSFAFLCIAALPPLCLEPTLQHMWHFIYATIFYVVIPIVWLFFCYKNIRNNKNL